MVHEKNSLVAMMGYFGGAAAYLFIEHLLGKTSIASDFPILFFALYKLLQRQLE